MPETTLPRDTNVSLMVGKAHHPLHLTTGRPGALQGAALVQAWKAPRWFNLRFTAPPPGRCLFPEAFPALIRDGEGRERSRGDLGTERCRAVSEE